MAPLMLRVCVSNSRPSHGDHLPYLLPMEGPSDNDARNRAVATPISWSGTAACRATCSGTCAKPRPVPSRAKPVVSDASFATRWPSMLVK